jgi:hypothetical protein
MLLLGTGVEGFYRKLGSLQGGKGPEKEGFEAQPTTRLQDVVWQYLPPECVEKFAKDLIQGVWDFFVFSACPTHYYIQIVWFSWAIGLPWKVWLLTPKTALPIFSAQMVAPSTSENLLKGSSLHESEAMIVAGGDDTVFFSEKVFNADHIRLDKSTADLIEDLFNNSGKDDGNIDGP